VGGFAVGRNNLFTAPTLSATGDARGKSVAQVVLRWLIQRGIVAIPKSVRRERMEQNLDVFDFTLTDDEIARIATLDTGTSLSSTIATRPWSAGSRVDPAGQLWGSYTRFGLLACPSVATARRGHLSLITRRSRVQIPPPPPRTQVRPGPQDRASCVLDLKSRLG
jgi:Aldo/keto reductase family